MWYVFSLALLAFALAGAASDVVNKRIPNRLVVAGLALALLLRIGGGWLALWYGVAGAAVALAIGFPFFLLRAFGGGDVKFLAACGAFVGLPLIGRAVLWAAAVGGLLAVWVILRRGVPLVAWQRTTDLLRSGLTFGQAGEKMQLGEEGALTAPYGVAIAAGTLLTWFGTAGGWIP